MYHLVIGVGASATYHATAVPQRSARGVRVTTTPVHALTAPLRHPLLTLSLTRGPCTHPTLLHLLAATGSVLGVANRVLMCGMGVPGAL